MKPYGLVFFDLDGTLADTLPGVMGSLNGTREKLRLPELSQAEQRSFMGARIRDFLRRVYRLDGAQAEQFVALFRQDYEQNRLFQAKAYEGIPQALKALRARGIKTAVATNKPQKQADALLEFLQLTALFDLVLGCDEMGGPGKGTLIRRGIRMLSSGANAVLVGDTAYDLAGAREGGADFIAVLYGFGFCSRSAAQGQGAVFAAETPAEAVRHILE